MTVSLGWFTLVPEIGLLLDAFHLLQRVIWIDKVCNCHSLTELIGKNVAHALQLQEFLANLFLAFRAAHWNPEFVGRQKWTGRTTIGISRIVVRTPVIDIVLPIRLIPSAKNLVHQHCHSRKQSLLLSSSVFLSSRPMPVALRWCRPSVQ